MVSIGTRNNQIWNHSQSKKFQCRCPTVPQCQAKIRGISSVLPRWAAEFTKSSKQFVKFCCGNLWALVICQHYWLFKLSEHCQPTDDVPLPSDT